MVFCTVVTSKSIIPTALNRHRTYCCGPDRDPNHEHNCEQISLVLL